MVDDFVVVGFTTAGFIGHVSKFGAEFADMAKNCAKQIRRHYKSVRVVSETEFNRLMEVEDAKRKEYSCY